MLACHPAEQIRFVSYLVEHGFNAHYKQLYEAQIFARIIVEKTLLDVYNTPKKPMNPTWHHFKDADLRAEIKRHWRTFFMGETDETSAPQITGFEEVEHYLSVFEPYRHLHFDFSALAEALQPFVGPEYPLPIEDYDELERIYKQVRNR